MNTNRLAVGAVSVLTALSLRPAVPVFAGQSYTPVRGEVISFDKYLVMDREAFPPNLSFRFEVVPGTARSATDTTTAVLPGTGRPVIGEAVFSADDAVKTQADASDFVSLAKGEGFVKKQVSVDFSGCTYTEPGVYRYLIREIPSAPGVTYDINTVRTADVYVTDEGEGLQVAACVLHAPTGGAEAPAPKRGAAGGTADVSDAGGRLGDKSAGFTNRYDTDNLTFSKHVAGNQAARDQYFRFTLKMTGAQPGTRYHVDLSGADRKSGRTDATKPAYRDQTNPEQLTADEKGCVTQAFYLQNGQRITVDGIAYGTKYELAEDAEHYTPKVAKETEDPDLTVRRDGVSDLASGITSDTSLSFVNTRGGLIPTGLFLGIGSSLAAAVLTGAALLLRFLQRRKKDEIR